MIPPNNLSFRLLRREELDIVLEWATAEGWNPGLEDAEAFWAADPEGFWGMEREGELIGSASTVVYEGGRLGFVGLFIVRPEWRGQGCGTAFWQFFIARLQERLMEDGGAALDGVFAMQAYYAKSGFHFTHRNLRMEGIAQPGTAHPGLCEGRALREDLLAGYDLECFGAKRPDFLQRWMTPREGFSFGWMEGAALRGYGVIRPCRVGFKIGPLFADTPEIAETIFVALCSKVAGAQIQLDVPENHPAALELAGRYGLKEGFGCARMTLGNFPPVPWHRIYGVTTFELG